MNNHQNTNLNSVGVLGATSFVGACLLRRLTRDGKSVVAYSRHAVRHTISNNANQIEWRKLTLNSDETAQPIPHWVCLAPIAVMPDYFSLFEAHGAKRIVLLSSTSRYTKSNSSDPNEQRLAWHLAATEQQVQAWAESRGIEWVILRPTLIYGLGQDKNISEIARFIRRFGLFPLLGKASGLRQPIHAEDVAEASFLALQSSAAVNRAYNISGAEIITYREMIVRLFAAMNKYPRLLPIPHWLFSLAMYLIHFVPRYKRWSSAMAERMNRDMTFDHTDAAHDFGFKPRGFELRPDDIPA
jgi:nucleoside-diphosphate-sugar epimerase